MSSSPTDSPRPTAPGGPWPLAFRVSFDPTIFRKKPRYHEIRRTLISYATHFLLAVFDRALVYVAKGSVVNTSPRRNPVVVLNFIGHGHPDHPVENALAFAKRLFEPRTDPPPKDVAALLRPDVVFSATLSKGHHVAETWAPGLHSIAVNTAYSFADDVEPMDQASLLADIDAVTKAFQALPSITPGLPFITTVTYKGPHVRADQSAHIGHRFILSVPATNKLESFLKSYPDGLITLSLDKCTVKASLRGGDGSTPGSTFLIRELKAARRSPAPATGGQPRPSRRLPTDSPRTPPRPVNHPTRRVFFASPDRAAKRGDPFTPSPDRPTSRPRPSPRPLPPEFASPEARSPSPSPMSPDSPARSPPPHRPRPSGAGEQQRRGSSVRQGRGVRKERAVGRSREGERRQAVMDAVLAGTSPRPTSLRLSALDHPSRDRRTSRAPLQPKSSRTQTTAPPTSAGGNSQ